MYKGTRRGERPGYINIFIVIIIALIILLVVAAYLIMTLSFKGL